MVKKLIAAILIAVLIVVFLPFAVALYLSPQDKLEKVDAIVVVSGGDTDARIREGVSLYNEKYAPIIIFSGAAAEGDVSNALAMKRIAVSKGVPANAILLDEDSKTTEENAINVSKMIKDSGINSIILVTSPYHQRRASNLFHKQLGKDFIVLNHSAKDENWSKKNWWDNEFARFLTFGELSKILINYIQTIGTR